MSKSEEVVNEEQIEKLKSFESDLKEGYTQLLIKPRIAMYLKALGFNFKWVDEKNTFLIPIKVKIDKENEKVRKHAILIQEKGLWISMRVGLLPQKQIPHDQEADLKEQLLRANADYPEFSFSVNSEGNIGYNQDIFAPALNFDVFMEELLSIPRAIKKFWSDILPGLEEAEDEEELEFFYT